jgi:hypothetical protein
MSSGFRKELLSKSPFFRLMEPRSHSTAASVVEHPTMSILSANRRHPGTASVNTSDWNMIQADAKWLGPLTRPTRPAM